MSKKQELQKGKISTTTLVDFTAEWFKLDHFAKTCFREALRKALPGLDRPDKCVNCGASMQAYIFRFDYADIQLILAMAQMVKQRMATMPFTEANKVHVQSATTMSYAEKSRTTQSEKLGLIAKVRDDNKKHVRGTWLITKRGWAALKGEPVPAQVKVFRDEIVERYEDMLTTIPEVLATSRKPSEREWQASDFYDIEIMAGRLL